MVATEIVKDGDSLVDEKEREFLKGDRPDGSPIGRYRSRSYSIFKNALNPLAGGYVDLMVTHRFINSGYLLKPKNGRYLLGFSDSKTSSLFEKYNKNASGQKDLQEINQQWFEHFQLNIIKPRFIVQIKRQLGQT